MSFDYPWLMLGDCLERMKEIPDGSVDMVLCDLPYGTTTCKWDVVIPFEPLWEQYWRIIKHNGVIVLFGSEPFSSYLRMSSIREFKYDWVWDKGKASNIMLAKKQPLKVYENIHIFYKNLGTYNPVMTKVEGKVRDKRNETSFKSGKLVNRNDGATPVAHTGLVKYSDNYDPSVTYPKNIVYFGNHHQKNKRFHPTQKPVALLEYLVKTYSNEGEVILDNTMGSGSTGVACVNTNRKFIGIEKDEKYFQIAQQRIKGELP